MREYECIKISKRWTDMIFRFMEMEEDSQKWGDFATVCMAMCLNDEVRETIKGFGEADMQEAFERTKIVPYNPITGKQGYIGLKMKRRVHENDAKQ